MVVRLFTSDPLSMSIWATSVLFFETAKRRGVGMTEHSLALVAHEKSAATSIAFGSGYHEVIVDCSPVK